MAQLNSAEQFGTRPNDYSVAEGGVAFAAAVPGATERDTVIDEHIVANNGGFTNHDAHAVIDEEAATNHRTRVNLDAGEETYGLRDCAGEEPGTPQPQGVGDPVPPHRVQS